MKLVLRTFALNDGTTKNLGFCTQMLFIAKELERIGDLSKVI